MKSVIYYASRFMNRRPSSIHKSFIDKRAKIGNGAQIVNSKIGKYTYIFGSKVVNTEIGAFCSIATECTIGGGSHPSSWASTSPVFYKGHNVFNKHFSNNLYEEFEKTTIGNDVWIGSKCLIKGGVTIGDGAIVGMGSVVTHDIPPYEVWGGNPAHLIKRRFDNDTIQELMDIRWWDKDETVLNECGDLFSDVHALIQYFKSLD